MSAREGLGFTTDLQSDVAPLNHLVRAMLDPGEIHVLRDPTRGGLATTLKEFALESGRRILVREEAVPVIPGVRGACDLLGLDPLYVANEGKCLAFVDPARADAVLEAMRRHPEGREAARIGEVTGESGRVVLRSRIGARRVVAMLSGEQLPRIC